MKRKIKILMLAIVLSLVSTMAVNAADATVTLKASETDLYPGDEFTITFSVDCNTEIEGVDTNLVYDKNNLEFIETDKVNSNWSIMDEDLSTVENSEYDRNIAAYCNQAKAKDDIYVITFKVKESATANTAAKISLNGIVLYDVNSESYDLGTKELEITIIEESANPGEDPGENPGETPDEKPDEKPQEKKLASIEITKEPTKTTYKVGEKFDKTGMKILAKYSDGSSKEITNYTIENGNKLVKGQTSVKISYTEGNITKDIEQKITVSKVTTSNNEEDKKPVVGNTQKDDNTKSENKLPDTGIASVLGVVSVVVIFASVCLMKFNRYKGI